MDNYEIRGRFLESVLACAVLERGPCEKGLILPTDKERVLREFANGIVDYSSEKSFEPITFPLDPAKAFEDAVEGFHQEHRETILSKVGQKLDGIILELVRVKSKVRARDRSFPENEFYSHFKGSGGCGGIYPGFMNRPTFGLPYNLVIDGINSLSSIFEAEKKHLLGIGVAMREYIKQDLEYIDKVPELSLVS